MASAPAWVLVIPVEATAAADILSDLIGGARWIWALAVTLLLTITTLASAGNYGMFEFWFAPHKVIAIVAFIGICVAAIFGLIPDSEVSGVEHLWQPDGFMPNGFGAVIAGMLITMFSFMGTEIVAIAAAESPNPEAGISRAVNSVIWRISPELGAVHRIPDAVLPGRAQGRPTDGEEVDWQRRSVGRDAGLHSGGDGRDRHDSGGDGLRPRPAARELPFARAGPNATLGSRLRRP